MTILIKLILHINYIVPIICPLNPILTPLKAIIRGFFVLFHIDI
jgi:hypothetical protein